MIAPLAPPTWTGAWRRPIECPDGPSCYQTFSTKTSLTIVAREFETHVINNRSFEVLTRGHRETKGCSAAVTLDPKLADVLFCD